MITDVTTKTGTDIETRQRALDAAKQSLAVFQEEAARIPAEIRAAAENMDSAQVIDLRDRSDALPTYLAAARLLVGRRSVALMEEKLAEAEAAYAVGADEQAKAEVAVVRVQVKAEEALGVARGLQYEANARKIALADQKRALDEMLRESAQPPGLNVRSVWQQGN